MLAPADPADAMAAYYALEYDPRRVQLTLHRLPPGQVAGFAAVCQTGQDLFVPLVILRARAEAVRDLLRTALHSGRPYRIVTTLALRSSVTAAMVLNGQQVNDIYVFDQDAYRPVLNVMVQPGESPFRFEIRAGGRVAAAAGINWRSGRRAEMYVYTEPEFQGRGWGRAVGAACVQSLLRERLLPLYTVAKQDSVSRRLAEAIGFRDSGAREFQCQGQLRT
jgi:predicted GNAT family acetyltransferase